MVLSHGPMSCFFGGRRNPKTTKKKWRPIPAIGVVCVVPCRRVLWMYSLIWMPLLVLMCLTRMGRGSPASSSAKAPAADGRHLPAGSVLQHQQQAAGLAGYGSLHPAGSGGSQFLDQPASAFSSSSTAAAAARRRTATATASLDLPPRYSVPGSFGRGGYADDGDGSSSMRSAASGRSLRQALNSGLVRGPAAAPPRASSDRLHMSRPSKLLQGAASLPPQAALNSSGSSARAGFSRQKTMPMPNRAAQGLNARLSYTGGEYGSGSPRGFDVQAADQQAAAGLVANSSSSASSQQVYLLMRKGQGQQVLQQGPADVHFVHDDDAAAAADALAA